jgi:hypothetical protein
MNDPKQPDLPPNGQFLVYQTEDGQVKIDVRLQGETAWLTQAHTATLFQTTVPNVNMHLRNIFAEGELKAGSVIQEFLITAADGKRYRTNHYNLDAIISVGYRVKSAVATRFCIWATQRLREFIVKGFVLDDELMENSQRRIRLLEAMARALYREWFLLFRFLGHEKLPRVASPLGDIPEGWEVKKLGDILELNYGEALKKEERHDGAFPVYGSNGVAGTHDTSLVKGRGIIVGRKGNVGSVFWCDDDFFVIDTAYFVTSSLPLRFLFYVLPTLNFINSDAAFPALSRNQAHSLEILIPPAKVLTKFCELADTFEQQAATLQRQIQNLRQTRDLLPSRLLSGNVKLQ